MKSKIEVKIPDIGDFPEVAVIEVMVKPGDVVKAEDPVITLESDKATMDVPSPAAAGTVKDVKIKVGDKVAEGTLVLTLETSEEKPATAPAKAEAPVAVVPAPVPTVAPIAAAPRPALAAGPAYSGKADLECEMLVLGSGPGGYSAAFRAADLGMKTMLVERYATLGGVCLNVGCIPSKALLHVAAVTDEAQRLSEHGVSFGAPTFDLDKLRSWKDKVVGKLVGGVGMMAKGRKVEVVRGVGKFLDPNHMEVALTSGEGQAPTGEKKVVRFARAIIAAGSQAVKLPFIPDDSRIVDSTGALELQRVPKKMLVIGGGIIGMEMATVYSALGARLDVVEMQDGLMPGTDRDLVRVWEKMNAKRFDRVMLKTRTVKVEALKEGIKVWFEGEGAPAEPQVYDFVLVATGRAPNGKRIEADKAGVTVTDRGFIQVDTQMRTSAPHIFAIGDIVGQPMLAHKAVHEGHVAAEAAAGQKSFFDAMVIPSVAYTDPEIAWVGVTEDEAKRQGRAIGKAKFPWTASGRAIANGRDEGFTKILVDEETHRVIGGGIVGTHAGDLISELALAIEMGADPEDIGRTIHPHPTLGESIGMVAEVFEGVCTDLMPARRR
ncbi:MAG: dihydrolipoamide dehydrogenase [Acidithiobacillales bacterium SM1_46]|nr:MAG: dihydrolipoamide dehydrogenase [Acidithiobacillales bacterium SM1_46]